MTGNLQLRSRKARGLGHERRAEILAAAQQLFVSEGFETVTTRRLADHVGLSQTGLYVYFNSKEEILETLCRDTFASLAQRLRQVAASVELGPELLRALGDAYVDFALEHPDEYHLAFVIRRPGKPAQRKDLGRPIEEQPIGLQAFLVVYEQVARLREAGIIKPVDAMAATQTIWAAVHGLVSLLISHPEFPWGPRRQLVAGLGDMILEGLLDSRTK
jgi:AcrR family transcriptional regulator